jgi:hypothetical protein
MNKSNKKYTAEFTITSTVIYAVRFQFSHWGGTWLQEHVKGCIRIAYAKIVKGIYFTDVILSLSAFAGADKPVAGIVNQTNKSNPTNNNNRHADHLVQIDWWLWTLLAVYSDV